MAVIPGAQGAAPGTTSSGDFHVPVGRTPGNLVAGKMPAVLGAPTSRRLAAEDAGEVELDGVEGRDPGCHLAGKGRDDAIARAIQLMGDQDPILGPG
jgi:hypothetical protein